ncbi:MAG: XTP/dITP diphosphatase [Candidatus Cohnella colombiensis]|uniref:dITP/XTP pyrophosphatase n=1 Tax=Candidatus Cohnella colombiensis TaxID=3121368 RepID=A0AA95F0A5_9BACL|nr:MAG: XTP/dITP diphosphatase [Cohnella sp.]
MMQSGSTLVIATRNSGKTREFREAFEKLGITVNDLHDVQGIPDIEETGQTFADNALLKAKAVADLIGLPVLADDSGLCVDALNGEPGVYSARYSGEGATDERNNAKLLEQLAVRGQSSNGDLLSAAQFVCALVLYDPSDDSRLDVEGVLDGYILREPLGSDGFGYDPLFWIPSHERSMAQLSVAEKNAISHRGQALSKLIQKLSES